MNNDLLELNSHVVIFNQYQFIIWNQRHENKKRLTFQFVNNFDLLDSQKNLVDNYWTRFFISIKEDYLFNVKHQTIDLTFIINEVKWKKKLIAFVLNIILFTNLNRRISEIEMSIFRRHIYDFRYIDMKDDCSCEK
jgi:hypothetical protein